MRRVRRWPDFLDAEIEALLRLPGREELIGQVVGRAVGQAARVAALATAPAGRVLSQIREYEKIAPASEAAPAEEPPGESAQKEESQTPDDECRPNRRERNPARRRNMEAGAMAEETEGRTWSKEIKTLGDKIVKLSVLQAKELGDYLEQEHGIKASAPAAVGMMPAAPAAEAAEEEKDSFDVVLTAVGDKKIPVVRALRDITNVGLREAKELVESAPRAVREGVSREEAEEIKAKLEEVGASVELR